MQEYIKNTEINYANISLYIPDVMNAMFNEQAASVIDAKELRAAFRIKMMQSKAWLIQKFLEQSIEKNRTILVIGGWLGFTSWVLFKNGYNNITEVDVDSRLHDFSKHLNRFNHSFKHMPVDVNEVDIKNYDIIINTSCEHIIDDSWFNNIKKDAIMILQSNNIDVPDHINKCNTLDEMTTKYPLELQYGGVLDYMDGTRRFMLIGKK